MSTDQLMQKVAEVAPRHHDYLLKTAEEIRRSPFRDEIVQELDGLIKKASMMQGFGTRMMGGAGAVGGAVAAGIAYSLAGDMYDAAKRGITKSRDYKTMLAANPDLKQFDAKTVQKSFSVLHKLNPEFAGEPTIAGAWVKRQATFGDDGMADTTSLKSLIESRKGMAESKKLPQVPRFSPGEERRSNEKHDREGEKHQADMARLKKPPQDPNMAAKLDEIMNHLNMQQQQGNNFFSGSFHPSPNGGQRTIP